MLVQLLALPDIVDARVIHLVCLADGPIIRAGNRGVLRLVCRFMVVRAANVLARQVLRVIEGTALSLCV